ncbi:DNA polymerase eta isoform X3 [Cynara cardunculus var. scolymus]|uniref:DNA polymerase eta isoform X3 n=1 Tax=Cynara cardunculus var. scolymus TaxID=59895 RepID=UPI000D62A972|nr:DNA polymerase eta isoform X3 [Cynara cardunculus var. scolymus]
MPVARPESSDSRIIAHVDMDCFYVQVEQRKQPHLRGQPTAVVQYNSWKGGGLIAVSYEARKDGVKRSMRGDEAKKVCPQIQLVQVPVARGKADLSIYRNAGSEVVSILARKGRCERASIDEVYLDLTDAAETMLKETPLESLESINEEVLKSHVLELSSNGNDDKELVREWLQRRDADHRDKLLACGAFIVAELRLQVLRETEFTCSAGIAHNKMLAKLASGMNKPAQQTIVPFASVKGLLEPLPIKKMKQLGGKLGSSLQIDLGVNTVGDLLQFSQEKLQDFYGVNTGTWLWNVARGISGEEVEGRLLPKSHGSGKTFPGPRALKTLAAVEKWLKELCEELSERLQSDLEKNKRVAHTLTLHANAYKSTDTDSYKKFPSKSCPLRYGGGKIQEDAVNLFQAGLREYLGAYIGSQCGGWGITGLSVSASKIVPIPSGTCSITRYFQCRDQFHSSSELSDEKFIPEDDLLSPSRSESHPAPHQTEQQTECGGEEAPVTYDITSFDQYENACKDEQASSDITREVSHLLSGAESCSTPKQNERQLRLPGKESKMKYPSDGIRSYGQKRKATKEKGTSSILRFLQSNSCSTSKQDNVSALQETKPLSSVQEPLVMESESFPGSQNGRSTNTWSYKADEIDQSVVDELPPELQEEVRTWLRPQKRANMVKQGSSIAHYFPPSKNEQRNPK